MNNENYLSKNQDWQKKKNAYGEIVEGINDIKQCIQLILTTPKGSVPLDPTFGCEIWKYIDAPLNKVRAYFIKEIVSAINLSEKRVNITSVEVENGDSPQRVHIRVYYTIKNSLINDYIEIDLNNE